MKKVMLLVSVLAFATMFAACDKKEIISVAELPASSQVFIKTHFPEVAITHIIKETDGLGKDYTVYLANGFDIDFDKKGNWDDVDGHFTPLPQSVLNLLPAGIMEYVTAYLPNSQIVEANRERYGYEIGLNGEIDLRFNSNGAFIGYED
ncbi:MAG: PepSY-like domain-containing protein [Bacteroidales bacterium]|jgi:hypothetical protein|nr:PepSY-like domain-containing protein [Bacteroidales bacterium]